MATITAAEATSSRRSMSSRYGEMMSKSRSVLIVSLLLCMIGMRDVVVHASIPCETDEECTTKLRKGSLCMDDGSCSNPFVKGCLGTLIDDPTTLATKVSATNYEIIIKSLEQGRVCNSDDLKFASKDCMNPYEDEFNYPEIRIHNGNWESSIFLAWIIQILLMEILKVPATVGLTTESTFKSGFYSPTNTLEYSSKAYPFEALRDADQCHLISDDFKECANVLPEVWNGQLNEWTAALNEGYVEPLEGNGQVGKGSWYVPAFSAANDESLVSFYGLRGEGRRQKLANDFRRPTSWGEYCQTVSKDNCTTADNTVPNGGGYPTNPLQASKYFAPPSFMGYFDLTDANNCTINPDTCIGHIVGPSCTWSTNIDAQLFWNDIKLKPDGPILPNGGYDFGSLIEIWRAANQTKSNVLFWWWRPEALVEEFHGTDAQFQMVLLPEATDICSRARVSTENRCSENIMERRGDPDGACDQEAHALQKVFSKKFAEASEATPPVSKSPGYDLMKALKITDLEINNMLRRWINVGVDQYGNDAREAVCGWVVENVDMLLDFMPPGYPKQLSEQSSYDTGFLHAATSVAAFCCLMVVVTSIFAIKFHKTKVFVYAQAHIVALILFGFFLITVGSILTTLQPSDPICVGRAWLVNLGYTIELVPILVKIAAINKILTSVKKMEKKRVKITRKRMLIDVGVVVTCALIFLAIWTIVDPPSKVEQRILPADDAQSATIETSLTCASDKGFWVAISLGWQGLLLLMATVLAFQSRDIVQEFNESRSLGTMIYSHFIFLVLRIIVYSLGQQEMFRPNVVAAVTSFLLSLDTLFATCIYLVPKCYEAKVSPNGGGRGAYSSNINSRMNTMNNNNHALSQKASHEIAAQNFQAKLSKTSTKFHANDNRNSISSRRGSPPTSSNTSNNSVSIAMAPRTTHSHHHVTSHYTKRIPSEILSSVIPEVSCEFELSDTRMRPVSLPPETLHNEFDPSESANDLLSGSYRTDATGAVIPTTSAATESNTGTIKKIDFPSASFTAEISGTNAGGGSSILSSSYHTSGVTRTPPPKRSVLRLASKPGVSPVHNQGPSSGHSQLINFGDLPGERRESDQVMAKPCALPLHQMGEHKQELQWFEGSSDDEGDDAGDPRFSKSMTQSQQSLPPSIPNISNVSEDDDVDHKNGAFYLQDLSAREAEKASKGKLPSE